MDFQIELAIDMALGGKLECSLAPGSAGDGVTEYKVTRKGSLKKIYSQAFYQWTASEVEVTSVIDVLENTLLFPLPPAEHFSYLDGWTTTLKIIRDGHNSVEYRWACGLPAEWQCFRKVLDLFRVDMDEGGN